MSTIKDIFGFFLQSAPVPHYILFIALILIVLAGVFIYVILFNSTKESKKLNLDLNDLKKTNEEIANEVSVLKSTKKRLMQEIENKKEEDPETLNSREYDNIFKQNKELIFLSKDFLVGDFIDLVKKYYPQKLNLKQKKVETPFSIQNRLKTILIQLEKVETLASVYHFKFSVDYYYQKVYYFLGQHEFYSAIEELRLALTVFAKEDNFYIYLVQLLMTVGQYEQANEAINTFLDYQVGYVPAYEWLIANFIELKKYKEAEGVCLKLLELKSTPEYESLLAYIYLLEGFISKAENRYETISARAEFPALTLFYLGKIDESQGKYKEALKKYLKLYNKGERNYVLLKNIVSLSSLFSQIEQCKKIIKEIQFYPDVDPEIFYLYIQNYNKKHKNILFFTDIIETLNNQRKIDYRLLNILGQFYLLLHKKQEALDSFNQSFQENPTYTPVLMNLVKWYLSAGDFEKAKEYLDKGFEVSPHSSDFSLLLSEYYYKQKDFESSKKILSEILDKEPSNILLYNRIGLVYLKEKNYTEALVWLHKLEEYEIKNVELLRNLGFAYLKLGNYTEAIAYYLKVLQMDAGNIDAYNNLGVIYSMKKEFKKAKKYLNKARQVDPNSKETNYNLALLYEKINKENSVKYYSKYKELIKKDLRPNESRTEE